MKVCLVIKKVEPDIKYQKTNNLNFSSFSIISVLKYNKGRLENLIWKKQFLQNSEIRLRENKISTIQHVFQI